MSDERARGILDELTDKFTRDRDDRDAEDLAAVEQYAHDTYAAATALRATERRLEALAKDTQWALAKHAKAIRKGGVIKGADHGGNQSRAGDPTVIKIYEVDPGEDVVSIYGWWANNADHAEVQAIADRLASVADDLKQRQEAGE